jgi:hypothetical protein
MLPIPSFLGPHVANSNKSLYVDRLMMPRFEGLYVLYDLPRQYKKSIRASQSDKHDKPQLQYKQDSRGL